MTGIERLRTLAGAWDEWGLGGTLAEIADEIERERAEDCYRMGLDCGTVWRVVADMERHCLGHEGMEDSPVARWARELREALGGAVTDEDREAAAWVREHGGLEEVEAHWSGRVPLTSVKRMVALHKAKRERLKAHALGLERKCAERGETIRELSGKAAKQSDEIRVMRDVIVETCARLGVEGTGSTVDDAQVIWREISRRLMPEGIEWPTVDRRKVDFKTPYRPSLGVLEAVSIYSNGACEVMSHDGIIKPVSEIHVVVPAADGEPLEVEQTVWDTDAETDTPLTVVEVSSDLVRCEYTWKDGKTYRPCYPPDQLTHQRPDTWQRIEDDATLSPEVYCHRNGIDISQKDGTEIFLADTVEPMARDLVRRAKALAEKENRNE